MSQALLMPGEPSAVEIVNSEGQGSAVLLCDHASNRIPIKLGNLGLSPQQLSEHIAWDPGAADVARQLSDLLDAPLLLSGYSRLVIDCNRPLTRTDSIIDESAGVRVPGNKDLSADQRQSRIDELFLPYHQAINQLLERRSQRRNILLSVHSYTPLLDNVMRPWQVGLSYERDSRLALKMIEALSQDKALVIGKNQPYPIEDHIDYTLPNHGEGRGLLHTMIEIRQDEIQTDEGCQLWAERLAEAYRRIQPELVQ